MTRNSNSRQSPLVLSELQSVRRDPRGRVAERRCQDCIEKIELRGIKQILSKFSCAWRDNVRYFPNFDAAVPEAIKCRMTPPPSGTCAALSRYDSISPDGADNVSRSQGWKENDIRGTVHFFFLLRNLSIQKVSPFLYEE